MKSIRQIACYSSCAFMLAMGACNKKDSQTPELLKETKVWNAVLGGNMQDEGRAIHKLSDGGYIIVANTFSNENGDVGATKGNYDLWLVRMDADGKKLWQKAYGGSEVDHVNNIVSNPDGSFVCVGYTTSNNSGDIGATKGEQDIWAVKIDANGNIVWNKTYGGNRLDIAQSIARTSDGKYLISGYTYSNNSGDIGGSNGEHDCFVAKITADGNLDWLKVYGGAGFDNGRKIIANTDGTMVIAGYTLSSNSGDVGAGKGGYDMYFLKLDASGGFLTSKNFGGNEYDFAEDMIPAGDGGYILLGATYSNNNGDVGANKGRSDAWIVKVDGNGELKWQKSIGGAGYEYFSGGTPSPDGGYVAILNTDSNNSGDIGANKGSQDIALVKFNATGAISSIKMMGGEEYDEMLQITNGTDGGYIAIGYSESTTGDVGKNNGDSDCWVIKIKEL